VGECVGVTETSGKFSHDHERDEECIQPEGEHIVAINHFQPKRCFYSLFIPPCATTHTHTHDEVEQ
jgi:hypothetical protein